MTNAPAPAPAPWPCVLVDGEWHAAPSVRCLFAGRHPIPTDPDPLYRDWDFAIQTGVLAPGHHDFCERALGSEPTHVVVTGLTPALTEFVFSWVQTNPDASTRPPLYLWHYDRDSARYWHQVLY